MDMPDGQDQGTLSARSVSSRHVPGLQTLYEDVDSEDAEVLVADSFDRNGKDWTPELQLIGPRVHNDPTETESRLSRRIDI